MLSTTATAMIHVDGEWGDVDGDVVAVSKLRRRFGSGDKNADDCGSDGDGDGAAGGLPCCRRRRLR